MNYQRTTYIFLIIALLAPSVGWGMNSLDMQEGGIVPLSHQLEGSTSIQVDYEIWQMGGFTGQVTSSQDRGTEIQAAYMQESNFKKALASYNRLFLSDDNVFLEKRKKLFQAIKTIVNNKSEEKVAVKTVKLIFVYFNNECADSCAKGLVPGYATALRLQLFDQDQNQIFLTNSSEREIVSLAEPWTVFKEEEELLETISSTFSSQNKGNH